MWLRSVDSALDSHIDSGNAIKFKELDHLGWYRKKTGVKMLIKWVEQMITDEEQSTTDVNIAMGEASEVDANTTLRLLKKAAQTKLAGDSPVIAVLVLACDRVTVSRCIDQLLKHRPSKRQFPIVVSRDCDHIETAAVIASYTDRSVFSLRQPDQSSIAIPHEEKHLLGYYKVARHYRWLLNLIFDTVGFEFAIVVEDDIDTAPDFFEYFAATRKLLERDPSLWCVSAWNDNGKSHLVDLEAGALIHRTDFFPGLGWMLARKEWARLAPGWPKAFWDDWLRRPEQRLGRACLRPEISRTRVFAAYGVSRGYYFEEHIRRVVLSKHFVPFTQFRLDHLLKDNYDPRFNRTVSGSPVVTKEQLLRRSITDSGPVRITYGSQYNFRQVAQTFRLMDDVKSGVPRTAYQGIVTFMYNGVRVYLAPKYSWKGYNYNWS
ncbi:alpha-1,3-mannosyl-glycoprotein 2-beta-N-acetylglucosaminyltransferase-like [Schistocerca gregaria]|uniref:alpha-1,3-mannosyl-glycoprotein 2-beta-N-acetylglucosaminyltransferase-like n=1 Tax=Schistocerca gregaria TaxID=7010 RepID=UPI00211DB7C4|nr:alpha-1,3-mannosyl-glycoprotein 2-beta-N-acetylglucosaminyltransferase-like [Schistocerca gregaria]